MRAHFTNLFCIFRSIICHSEAFFCSIQRRFIGCRHMPISLPYEARGQFGLNNRVSGDRISLLFLTECPKGTTNLQRDIIIPYVGSHPTIRRGDAFQALTLSYAVNSLLALECCQMPVGSYISDLNTELATIQIKWESQVWWLT